MNTRLFFMFQPGCEACEAAKPELEAFQNKHPFVQVVRADIVNGTYDIGGIERPMVWGSDRWAPRVTPTYLLARPGERLRALEGGKTAAELSLWIFGE